MFRRGRVGRALKPLLRPPWRGHTQTYTPRNPNFDLTLHKLSHFSNHITTQVHTPTYSPSTTQVPYMYVSHLISLPVFRKKHSSQSSGISHGIQCGLHARILGSWSPTQRTRRPFSHVENRSVIALLRVYTLLKSLDRASGVHEKATHLAITSQFRGAASSRTVRLFTCTTAHRGTHGNEPRTNRANPWDPGNASRTLSFSCPCLPSVSRAPGTNLCI